jgi:peroxiredoxin Q/BCP
MKLKRARAIFTALLPLFFFFLMTPRQLLANELKVGDSAPDFSSKDEFGQPVTLSQFKGKTLVLYFYPKDGTPGCTAEAQSFRDHYAEFTKRNIKVLGVSFDSEDRHKKFQTENELPFPLLAENQKEIAEKYGVGGFLFADRDTITIDPAGKISGIYRSVTASDHAQFILDHLK